MPRDLMSVSATAGDTAFGGDDSREEVEQSFAVTGAFNERLEREGRLVLVGGLQPALTVPTVDVPDLDAALNLAGEAASACRGAVEVRPFHTQESVRSLRGS